MKKIILIALVSLVSVAAHARLAAAKNPIIPVERSAASLNSDRWYFTYNGIISRYANEAEYKAGLLALQRRQGYNGKLLVVSQFVSH